MDDKQLDKKKNFLERMGISIERFDKLDRNVDILIEIAKDYEIHKNDLLDEASYIANKLQRCDGVHTVRSRIKDTSHLIEKIIRKWECDEISPKYDAISKDNYKNIISDLIGVRAIYLFKNDWEMVHKHILSRWQVAEPVVIYHRSGDDLLKYEQYEDCQTQVHNKGYRSIHYIIPATKIDGQQVNCEVQTRTIFEEGWSEIDHKVRYPSFSDDIYLQEFLNIFNRIAGSADEMGNFVNSLRELVQLNQFLEDNKRLSFRDSDIKIKKLESKIEKLFEENAKLEEIKDAYQLLKNANAEKNKIDKSQISSKVFDKELLNSLLKSNPYNSKEYRDILKKVTQNNPFTSPEHIKLMNTLYSKNFYSSEKYENLIKGLFP